MNRYGAIRTTEEKEQKAKGWSDVAFHLVSNLRKKDRPKALQKSQINQAFLSSAAQKV
jgi:hypothetical protein